MLALSLMACRPAPTSIPPPEVAPITLAPQPPPAAGSAATVVSATCEPDPDNALRARCEVALSAPGLAVVEVRDGREAARFVAREVATVHELPVWGLTADARWSLAAGAEGDEARVALELVTGPLPEALALANRVESPGDSRLAHVLLPASCGTAGVLVALDGEGRVRWYEDVARTVSRRWMEAFQFTDEGTVLAVTGRDTLTEVDLAGATLWRKEDFDPPCHHDVFRRDGWTWVLQAAAYDAPNGVRYVEDVVTTFDPTHAEVARWEAHDHLDATVVPPAPDTEMWDDEFPGATDAWHTNGVFATGEGDLLLSMHAPSAVLRVSGATGEVLWTLVGPGRDTTLHGELVLLDDDARFLHQHQPRWWPDGTLGIFDNQVGDRARGLKLRVDAAAGTVSFVRDWPVGLSCPAQSSMFELADDHVLLTCAKSGVLSERDGAGVEVWRAELACADGSELPLVLRGQPLDLWSAATAGVSVARIP